eukprot:COSAG01_NODE_2019_length_8634_cov_14.764499_5_plen_41_part_00
MISYQWDHQQVVKRIVNELQARDYRTWFGGWCLPFCARMT